MDALQYACQVAWCFLVWRQPYHPLEHIRVRKRACSYEFPTQPWPDVPSVAWQAGGGGIDNQDAILLPGRPTECDAEFLAHGAAAAIGAHQVAGRNVLRAIGGGNCGSDRVRALRQIQ